MPLMRKITISWAKLRINFSHCKAIHLSVSITVVTKENLKENPIKLINCFKEIK